MTIARADTESIIVRRVGPLMTVSGMAITITGGNGDLNDPLGYAIRSLGYSVLSVVSIVDADVAQVTDAEIDEFLDICTIRTLYAILGNYDDVDIKVGPRDEKLSQLREQVENKIALLEKQAEISYGFGLSTPEARVIVDDFVEHTDE